MTYERTPTACEESVVFIPVLKTIRKDVNP